MPRLSLIAIEAKRMSYFISNLWSTIALIGSREEAVIFLKELLTPTEIRMLSKRIQIAKMLVEGYKYEDIRNFVRVTDSTISSVNNQLQFGDGGYTRIIERLIKLEEKRQDKLEGRKGIFDPGPYVGRKTTEWALGKLAQKAQNYTKKKSVEKTLK